MEKIKTKINKTKRGHQVALVIGNETFLFEEKLPEKNITSLALANWDRKLIKNALTELNKYKWI